MSIIESFSLNCVQRENLTGAYNCTRGSENVYIDTAGGLAAGTVDGSNYCTTDFESDSYCVETN